jgi:ribosomal protein S12 methylthiotransferase
LTQLSAQGYQTSKTFEGADLVIVNTCGFIDDAVKESLDTIGEAFERQRQSDLSLAVWAQRLIRTVATWCALGTQCAPVTGPHATQEVMDAVHLHLPKPHDAFVDLIPSQHRRRRQTYP